MKIKFWGLVLISIVIALASCADTGASDTDTTITNNFEGTWYLLNDSFVKTDYYMILNSHGQSLVLDPANDWTITGTYTYTETSATVITNSSLGTLGCDFAGGYLFGYDADTNTTYRFDD